MEMQSNGSDPEPDECLQERRFDDESSELNSKLFLDGVGLVFLSVDSAGISWKRDELNNDSSCLAKTLGSISAADIKFSDIYAAELDDFGLVQQYVPPITGWCLLKNQGAEMHRFKIHGVQILKSHWVSVVYTFGHADLHVCRTFVNQINACLKKELGRPKSLMVFVNPLSGRRKGQRTWEAVAPVFTRANIRTKVIVTERAGHAFDAMASMGNQELYSYDGVVAVGGDGFFNEILNGFLLSRLKAPCPPIPPDFVDSHDTERFSHVPDPNGAAAGTSENEDQSPLLSTSECNGSGSPFFKANNTSSSTEDGGAMLSIPNNKFRFGLIPAGSTDAIVMCTTGARDPITSALQIVLGKRVSLDIAQVVKWKTTYESKEEPSVRYTASFVGYGFYGDVIKESEKYRWMGPSRYDFAGTKVFLKRRSYEAEVAYLEVKSCEQTSQSNEEDHVVGKVEASNGEKCKRVICRANCKVCSAVYQPTTDTGQQVRWLSSRGRFLSVGSAVITCRNERAPDGLVADAHLSDGFLHLILIKECPRPLYLRHLLELAKKGGSPLDFKFIEHHKTLAFAFTSFGEQSIWNLDGELLQAHKLSVQVFRGLISLFATGPQV